MAKEIVNEDTGEKETFYTKEEMEAKDKELTDAKALNEERSKNFNGVNEKIGKLEEEVKLTKTQLAEKEVRERDSAKNNSGSKFYGANADLKAKVDANYAVLAGMPENTPEEIQARMEAAARLSGISVGGQPNPIYSPIDGEPPRQAQAKAKEDEFLKSEKGQAALKAMGLEPEAPKQ